MCGKWFAIGVALIAFLDPSQAGPVCQGPADAAALRTAALQQEMMVAALTCKEVAAYNDFVLSHRAALQASDKTLLRFFVAANPRGGDDAYNLYKTELANAASLRSMHEAGFCTRVRTNFEAAQGRSLEATLAALPSPVDTGTVRCPLLEAAEAARRPVAAPESDLQVSARTP
jgi:hypothetical protein